VEGSVRQSMAMALVLSGAFVIGCGGGGRSIELRYQRPAEYDIPANIRCVGVARFGGQTAQDTKWGDIASDQLAADLDAYGRKYERYELVDRKRLAAILDEQDLQMAIADVPSATEAGKVANVDAMIYGTVHVTNRDQHETRTAFDPLARRTKTVSYVRRYCMAAVNFTMDDITTGKTLAAVAVVREYDSQQGANKNKGISGAKKFMGFAEEAPPPSEKVISDLIDQCVQEFLGKISPHDVVVTVKLAGGGSELVKTGNKLATAGDYKEALECYQQAMKLAPADHEAVFNAGVMHEALGELQMAEPLYDKAFQIEPKERYIFARQRVRQECDK